MKPWFTIFNFLNYNGKSARFRLAYEKFSDLLCRDINASRLRTYIYDCQFKKE
jgi:hypothetical protein